VLSNGLRRLRLLIRSRGITDWESTIKSFCALLGHQTKIEPATRCQRPRDGPNSLATLADVQALHGHSPSPGNQMPEVGARSSFGAGQRRRLEVGQCLRRRRLPFALKTAVISTHDWTHSHCHRKASRPLSGTPTSQLGTWSSAISSYNRSAATGQVFLCKPRRKESSRPAEHQLIEQLPIGLAASARLLQATRNRARRGRDDGVDA
jgi:hypothetical protein